MLSGFRQGSSATGPTSRNVGFGALTEAYTPTEMVTFNSAVQTYLTAIGRS
jgi:hypothetical protein